MISLTISFSFFFFNDTATTEIYTLSLHDALPIYLEHHVDVGALAAELLHEVLHDDRHEVVVLLGRDVRDDVAEEARVLAHPQGVLHLAEDDLLARAAMFDDALEPRVLAHLEVPRVAPELLDELLGIHCRHASPPRSRTGSTGARRAPRAAGRPRA